MSGHPRSLIAVFGDYSPKPGDPAYQTAYDVGRAVASAGFDVCNGGYKGTMEASAKGAQDAGGATVGVTCRIFRNAAGELSQPNAYIDRVLWQDDLMSMLDTMIRFCVGYVFLPGGTGTLCELSLVWEYVCKGFIEPRPIYLVGDFWKPVIETILSVRTNHGECVRFVGDGAELSQLLRSP